MAYQQMKKLASILSDSSRKISMRKAILEAGYSQATAAHPKQITRSKAWKDLVNELLPEDKMLNKLQENALQKRSIHASNTALDMFFRLRGKYQKEQENQEETEDLDELIKENEKLKSKLYARRTAN